MNKPVAITLLILGGIAAVFGMALLDVVLFFTLMWSGLLIGIAAVMGMAFGADRLRILFKRKYGMNAAKFCLCVYVPSIAASGVCFITVILLDKAGYFTGFFAGLGEFIFSLSYILTASAFAAAGAIWLAVSACVRRKLGGLPVFNKPAAIAALAISGAALWTAMLFLTASIRANTESVILPVLIIFAVTFGIDMLRKLYAKKFSVGAPLFYICAYYAALGGKIYTFCVYLARLGADKEYGFPTAADNALFLRYAPTEAAAILICAALWYAVSKVVSRRKEGSL